MQIEVYGVPLWWQSIRQSIDFHCMLLRWITSCSRRTLQGGYHIHNRCLCTVKTSTLLSKGYENRWCGVFSSNNYGLSVDQGLSCWYQNRPWIMFIHVFLGTEESITLQHLCLRELFVATENARVQGTGYPNIQALWDSVANGSRGSIFRDRRHHHQNNIYFAVFH